MRGPDVRQSKKTPEKFNKKNNRGVRGDGVLTSRFLQVAPDEITEVVAASSRRLLDKRVNFLTIPEDGDGFESHRSPLFQLRHGYDREGHG
jgi:hypothetical protein